MQSHASLMQSPFEPISYNVFCKYECSNIQVGFLSVEDFFSLPFVLCNMTLPGSVMHNLFNSSQKSSAESEELNPIAIHRQKIFK